MSDQDHDFARPDHAAIDPLAGRSIEGSGPGPITYAKVGGPPTDWHSLEILLEGVAIKDVIEADVGAGWIRHFTRDDYGWIIERAEGGAVISTTHGRVEILRRAAA